MQATARHLHQLAVALFLVTLAGPLQAQVDAIYTGWFSNRAISGYDAVAYFTEGRAVEGSEDHVVEYRGAEWLFSSEAHRRLFEQDPEAYAPAYGGYCAYAMAEGDTVSAEPDLWTIHEGRLYLNYSERINERWQQDMEGYIEAADAEWAALEKQE